MSQALVFLKGYLQNPFRVGAIMESSRYLVDNIMSHVELKEGDCVVELGAGLGVVTARLLAALPKDAILLSFEMNPEFAKHLREKFKDPRFFVVEDKAQNLPEVLQKHGRPHVDVMVSIVPLKHPQAPEILETVKACLKKDGRYVQVSLVGKDMLSKQFLHLKEVWTLRNFPPEKVHVCQNSLK